MSSDATAEKNARRFAKREETVKRLVDGADGAAGSSRRDVRALTVMDSVQETPRKPGVFGLWRPLSRSHRFWLLPWTE